MKSKRFIYLFPILVQIVLSSLALAEETNQLNTPIELIKDDVLSHFQNTNGWSVVESVIGINGKSEFITTPLTGKTGGILSNGNIKNDAAYLFTKDEFGDVAVSLEFVVPKESNSGIYLMGRYEIQIMDSYGKVEPKHSDLGGVYQRWEVTPDGVKRGYEGTAPLANASKVPGEWQRLDIVFRSPRFDNTGTKTENARFISVHVNGILVQQNVEVTGPTRSNPIEGEAITGPLVIQGDHGPIAIRSMTVKPIEDIDAKQDNKNEWVDLFNGSTLDGWTVNIGNEGDETSLKGNDIFAVKNGVIQVYPGAEAGSKQYNANLIHYSFHTNYHLQVEYRWLQKKFHPRTEADRDAGILFHIHSKPNEVWPPCIEMQLGDGKPGVKYVSGDIYVLFNSQAETPSENNQYKTNGELVLRGELKEKRISRGATSIYAENPLGEWNKVDLIVHGSQKAEYYINGKLVNEVFNMKFKNPDGQWKPLESGQISVQAEWAEIEYRTIRIKDLKE